MSALAETLTAGWPMLRAQGTPVFTGDQWEAPESSQGDCHVSWCWLTATDTLPTPTAPSQDPLPLLSMRVDPRRYTQPHSRTLGLLKGYVLSYYSSHQAQEGNKAKRSGTEVWQTLSIPLSRTWGCGQSFRRPSECDKDSQLWVATTPLGLCLHLPSDTALSLPRVPSH